MIVAGREVRLGFYWWSRRDRCVGVEWTALMAGFSCRILIPPLKIGFMQWKL